MPDVSLAGGLSPIDGLDLILAVGSGPVLSLSLPPNHPWKLEDQGSLLEILGERGEVSWGAQSLSFRFTGFQSSTGGTDSLVGALLSDEVLDWFERLPNADAALQMLVYQRQEADANGWGFLRRVLGDAISKPHGADELDSWFPVGSCILRRTSCDNLAHLNRVLGLLAVAPTRAFGWCAVDVTLGDEPLRLLGLDAPPLVLDKTWGPGDLSQVYFPHRMAPSRVSELRRGFGKLESENAAKLVRELSRAGMAGAGEGLLEGAAQLPCLPGVVSLAGGSALCDKLRYKFDLKPADDDSGVALVVEARLGSLPASAGLTASTWTAKASFAHWDEASGKTRLQLKHSDRPWQLMGDGDSKDTATPDSDKNLVAEALTPFAGRNGFAGFYVSHREDDELVVEVRDGEVPRATAELQVFCEALEAPDLVINTETIVLSGIGKEGDLSTADGLSLDGAAGIVDVFAQKHVTLKQRVTVTDASTTLAHDGVVTGSAKIDGKLDVGS